MGPLIGFSGLSIQGAIMRRGQRGKTQKPCGGWDSREKGIGEMEGMGVVFSNHELKAGSLGSCAAEECCGGWKASSTRSTLDIHKQ